MLHLAGCQLMLPNRFDVVTVGATHVLGTGFSILLSNFCFAFGTKANPASGQATAGTLDLHHTMAVICDC